MAHDFLSPLALERADFDRDGHLAVADIDLLSLQLRSGTNDSQFDTNQDGIVNTTDRHHWIEVIRRTCPGDANLDGLFGTADLIAVFQAGQYEDGITGNASWSTGDWDGDGDFGTGDLVAAFQSGGFELGFRPVDPPSARLATNSDTGTQGDLVTNQQTVTLEGQTIPFAAVDVNGSSTAFADAQGRFQISDVSLALGENQLLVSIEDINGIRASSALPLNRIPTSTDEKFAYAPWGSIVDFETLYPEIPRSLLTAFLPAGATRHQILSAASAKSAPLESVPVEPPPRGGIQGQEQEPGNVSVKTILRRPLNRSSGSGQAVSPLVPYCKVS